MKHVVHNTREVKNQIIVYCSTFSCGMMNKIVHFCYKKVYVRLQVHLHSICEKRKKAGD